MSLSRDFAVKEFTRRGFVSLAIAAVCAALPAHADEKKAKIGFVDWFPPSMRADLDHFREGMTQFGYIEGKNYEVEAYFTAGSPALTRDIVDRLVKEPVDSIVAVATPAVHIAKEATQTIPIVMASANALATGLVPSLAHPGGNLTGVSLLMTDLAGKRLEFLREIRPSLQKVAFLGTSKDPNTATFIRETQTAADRLGVALSVPPVDGPEAIDQALFDAIKQEGCEAVIVQPIFSGYQDRIVPMAMRDGLPVVADFSFFADAGALLTYGTNQTALIRRMAYYVDRILKGANPGDLPVEQPTEFELIVNRRTAAKFGWTVPRDLLVLANRVIE
jgi:putative tryptophan/tyrosine transport system substrate-binding protein